MSAACSAVSWEGGWEQHYLLPVHFTALRRHSMARQLHHMLLMAEADTLAMDHMETLIIAEQVKALLIESFFIYVFLHPSQL